MINDNELIEIFIEESNDILEALQSHYNAVEARPVGTDCNDMWEAMLRELHTFKGSARMVGLEEFSNYLHGAEQLIQKIQTQGGAIEKEYLSTCKGTIDFCQFYLNAIIRGTPLPAEQIPFHSLQSFVSESANTSVERTEIKELPLIVFEDKQVEKKHREKKKEVSGDAIRVKTSLLEKFGKLAVQINVARSHLTQQMASLHDSLSEMTKEIKLTQEKMRHLQVKADANLRMVNSVNQQATYEEFDILELDRYTFLQQSARALINNLERLENLNCTIINSVKSAEQLLVEQGRSAKELEAEITHVRMISIDQLVPRLELIVQQVSEELQKEVHFVCLKAEGEMDRNILEKLLPSLEHMIRNAIDHGIESHKVRVDAGKPAHGVITLAMSRVANEIVLCVRDDGQGINVEKVREKAIEKNLWPENAPFSTEAASRIILYPGFSTKEVLSAISGRGVGMDVVNAQVNKLGGTLEVDTQASKGTAFTIRLPYMQSLNKALIITSGKQFYAVLLANLSGITRLSFSEIDSKLNSDNNILEYSGKTYLLFYLPELLGRSKWEACQSEKKDLPIIFMQSETENIAFVIDGLIGSREIVIKPAGIQLQFVKEISGVSLLGDGSIILILNASYLIQRAQGIQGKQDPLQNLSTKSKNDIATILIVDDSATVRQVTSRLLKRHHCDVLTANDGLEALAQLNQNVVDLVLLDIEMPHMDGFEVIEKMKQSSTLCTIPIVMITSRSGGKHRLRAMSAGANAYLVKPYQEDSLLLLLREFKLISDKGQGE